MTAPPPGPSALPQIPAAPALGPFQVVPLPGAAPPITPSYSPFFTLFSQASAVTPCPDHPLSD